MTNSPEAHRQIGSFFLQSSYLPKRILVSHAADVTDQASDPPHTLIIVYAKNDRSEICVALRKVLSAGSYTQCPLRTVQELREGVLSRPLPDGSTTLFSSIFFFQRAGLSVEDYRRLAVEHSPED